MADAVGISGYLHMPFLCAAGFVVGKEHARGIGTGGCSTYDVMAMLKKSRQQVVDCRVDIEAERADAVPAVFTRINMHFVVTGVGLKESHVKRAVELSAEKYCSASWGRLFPKVRLARIGDVVR